ncbi:MAG: hypothetical protein MJY82_04085 [Fibrobacter sp.]|nr:hypothetical protein [Fibrobacter sp.]
MRKSIILVALLLLVTQAFCVRPPREHRGLFFSAGLGISYGNFSNEDVDYYGGYHWAQSGSIAYDVKEGEYVDVSYFSMPVMQFRFGASIGNVVALYSSLEFSMGKVFDGCSKEAKYEDGELTYLDYYDYDGDRSLNAFVGFGFSIYPFRNPNSPLNGLYVANVSGVNLSYVLDDDSDSDQGIMVEQFELGKDWWMSDTWSIGVSFSYSMFVSNFEDITNSDMNKFQLLFKITRG